MPPPRQPSRQCGLPIRFANPRERPREKVREEVRDGIISPEAAAEHYGLVEEE